MFVDTLPFPYYDMLIVNTFVELGDLMYSVGRIEDGIKKGRIVDTGASKEERKRFVLDEHVQAMSGEKKKITYDTGRACQESPLLTRVCPSPLCRSPIAPKVRTGIRSRVSPRLLPEQEKKKGQSVPSISNVPILIQNYGIFVIPARPRRPPYPKR